jgi:hypothetical protein
MGNAVAAACAIRGVASESKREEVSPFLLCYTAPVYRQERRREGPEQGISKVEAR